MTDDDEQKSLGLLHLDLSWTLNLLFRWINGLPLPDREVKSQFYADDSSRVAAMKGLPLVESTDRQVSSKLFLFAHLTNMEHPCAAAWYPDGSPTVT